MSSLFGGSGGGSSSNKTQQSSNSGASRDFVLDDKYTRGNALDAKPASAGGGKAEN